MRRPVNSPGFLARLVFALGCFVRLVVDARFAAAVRRLLEAGEPRGSAGQAERALPSEAIARDVTPTVVELEAPKLADTSSVSGTVVDPRASARVLLALLQREGRFVDFLEQSVDGFSDADVGAAARVVHVGCKKALAGRVVFAPVRDEDEGARVCLGGSELDVMFSGAGGLRAGTFTIVHRGWRITQDDLPALTAGHDGSLLQAAEVE